MNDWSKLSVLTIVESQILSPVIYVCLSQRLDFSEPWFSHLSNETIYLFQGVLVKLERNYRRHLGQWPGHSDFLARITIIPLSDAIPEVDLGILFILGWFVLVRRVFRYTSNFPNMHFSCIYFFFPSINWKQRRGCWE